MKTGYETYPARCDSGIDWVGLVPEHWEVMKLGFRVKTIVPMRDKPTDLEGEIPWVRIEDFSGKYIEGSKSGQGVTAETIAAMNLKTFPKGTVLCSCSCNMGRTAIVAAPVISNQTFIGLVPDPARLASSYLYYLMQAATPELTSLGTGAIQQYLSQDDFKALRFAFPTALEQTQIANFLDYETAKIDALIEKQQQLIRLLEEKRQAVISHAVTKGLNPDAPMRDSGVEWLGEVPAHWSEVCLKFFCDVRDGTHGTPSYVNPSEDSFPLVTSKDISEGEVRLDDAKHISRDDYQAIARRSLVGRGDILMPMIGSVGGAVLVESDVLFAIKNVALFKASNAFSSRWLRLLLDSDISLVQFDLMRAGGVQSFVSLTTLRNLVFPFPPLEEQQAIAEHLGEQCDQFDVLAQRQQEAADLLQERRTALISAAVTGKIDVRGWSPPVSTTSQEVV